MVPPLALLGRWMTPGKAKGRSLWGQAAINFAVGLAALVTWAMVAFK